MVQIIHFSAGGLRCAMPLAGVQSVIQMMAMAPSSDTRRGIVGTINLHSRIITVYSLRQLLGTPDHSPRISDMLLIAQAGGETIAVWIDEIRGVEDLVQSPRDDTQADRSGAPPDGIIITREGVVYIADLASFLQHPPDKTWLDALMAFRTGDDTSFSGMPDGLRPDPVAVSAILNERASKMLPTEPGSFTSEMTEILRFQLAYRQYAVEMKYVREVILTGEITPVPGTPDFISGICVARGQIISLVDLRALLKIPEKGLTDLNRVIVITDGKITFGILADNISGVGTISLDRVVPPHPGDLPGSHRYLKGILDRDLLVLDAEAILCDPDIIIDDA